MSWVFDHSEASGSCRLVLLSIANHADPAGENAWPTIATIARESRCARSTVFLAIEELEQAGAITVEHGLGGPNVKRADRKPNLYSVIMATGSEIRTSFPNGVRSDGPRGPISAPTGSEDRTGTIPEPSVNARSLHPDVPNQDDEHENDRAVRERFEEIDRIKAGA